MTKVEDTYTDIPTIFEIAIREDGWIHDVHLHLSIDNRSLPAIWNGYTRLKDGSRASIFKLEYIFRNTLRNQKATFHYFIDGIEYVCEPMIFNVHPFYEC